jgi:Spy/CpxP family protein refolding chaperone
MRIVCPLWLAISVAAFGFPPAVRAQHNPNGRITVASLADPYLVLIRDPVVQSELRLTDRQRQSIRALADELDGPLWTLRNQGGEKAAQRFRELNQTAESRMEQILTAAQAKRLAQLRVAVYGLKALLREDVADKLQLSEPQRKEIAEVLREAERPKEESPPPAKNGKIASKPAKSKPSATSAQARVTAILSRQQLDLLRDMLGPPVDASKLGFVKFKAPELDGKDGWLSSAPLTMSQLQGKVVALHFWTFG